MLKKGRVPFFDSLVLIGAGLLYLLLCAATALSWEPCHDEGITWQQTTGKLPLVGHPGQAFRVTDLYAVLDNSAGRGPSDLLAELLGDAGMHPPAYYLWFQAWLGLVGGGSRLLLALPACLLLLLAHGAQLRSQAVAPGDFVRLAGSYLQPTRRVICWCYRATRRDTPFRCCSACGRPTSATYRWRSGPRNCSPTWSRKCATIRQSNR